MQWRQTYTPWRLGSCGEYAPLCRAVHDGAFGAVAYLEENLCLG